MRDERAILPGSAACGSEAPRLYVLSITVDRRRPSARSPATIPRRCRSDVAYACLRDMGVSYAETTLGRAQAERAERALAAGDITVQ
jgi:hypothetical protein